MAQKLHDEYGFNYTNLQVLLGGWHAWQDAGYPVEVATAAPAAPVGTTVPGGPASPVIPLNPQPAGTPQP